MVFGHIGDRFGRRLHAAAVDGADDAGDAGHRAAADHAAHRAGARAGCCSLLRCVMAFSVGGEYTGVVAYLLEGARADRRGLITSLASAASEVGALLAVALSALTVAALSAAASGRLGLAHSVLRRRGAGRQRLDRALDHAGIARFRAPACGRHACPTRRCAIRWPITSRPCCAHLRHLGAGLDHLLRRHHLCAGVPDLVGRPCRRPRRCGCPRSPPWRSSWSRRWPVRCPTGSAASRC